MRLVETERERGRGREREGEGGREMERGRDAPARPAGRRDWLTVAKVITV